MLQKIGRLQRLEARARPGPAPGYSNPTTGWRPGAAEAEAHWAPEPEQRWTRAEWAAWQAQQLEAEERGAAVVRSAAADHPDHHFIVAHAPPPFRRVARTSEIFSKFFKF